MWAPAAVAQTWSAGSGQVRGSGAAHLESWLAAPGGPLWEPLAALNGAEPLSWSGHTWAALAAGQDPVPGAGVTWPGATPPRPEAAWIDTLTLEPSRGSAWWGWSPGYVRVSSGRVVASRGKADAILSLARGGFARQEHGLVLTRADSVASFSLFTNERRRGPAEAFDRSGEHLYGASAAWRLGDQRWSGAYANRASAARLAGGEEETHQGESGCLGLETALRGWRLSGTGGRGRTAQRSFGALAYSRREAQAWWAEGSLQPTADSALTFRGAWRRPEVERFAAGAFAPRLASEWWLAARRRLPTGHGDVLATLGAGGHTGKRVLRAAPELAWTPRGERWSAALWTGRALTPVWTDLAPGHAPFLEDSWLGGTEARWLDPEVGSGLRGALTVGRTRHRAILARRPLPEEWLRQGAAPDPGIYEFGRAEVTAAWRHGRFGAGASGEALSRDVSALQPQVDPARRGMLWVEGAGRLFKGDLDIHLRLEAEGVGPREGEVAAIGRLPGYARYHATVRLAIGDAALVLRGYDLTDERPPQVWVDHATGAAAHDPGREVRFAVTWRVFD